MRGAISKCRSRRSAGSGGSCSIRTRLVPSSSSSPFMLALLLIALQTNRSSAGDDVIDVVGGTANENNIGEPIRRPRLGSLRPGKTDSHDDATAGRRLGDDNGTNSRHHRRHQHQRILQEQEQQQQQQQPQTKTQSSSCHHEGKWHASMTKPKTCTNDNTVPKSWEKQSGTTMNTNYLFDSWIKCCEVMFGSGDCVKIDVCTDQQDSGGIGVVGGVVSGDNNDVGDDNGDEDEGSEQHDDDSSSNNRCKGRLWHPDITASITTCTNTVNDYPSYWDNPVMKGVTMFETPDECCDKLKIGGGALSGDSCFVREASDCKSPEEVGAGSVGGGSPPVGGSYDDCEAGRRWHVSKSKAETCTNDDDFPPAWSDEFYLGKTMFFSYKACCDSLGAFGLSNCYAINVCTDPLYTSGTGSTCTYPWHPSSKFDGCSNSPPGTYPNDWTVPGVSDRYLFRTHEDCCNSFFVFDDLEDCQRTDYCSESSPTTSLPHSLTTFPPTECGADNLWHKGKEPNKCTNDLDYPLAWDDPAKSSDYLFDTPEECCSKFVRTETCIVVDICGTMTMEIEPKIPSSPTTATASSTASTKATTHTTGCEENSTKKQCSKSPGCQWSSQSSCVKSVRSSSLGKQEVDDDDCSGRKYHPTSELERKCSNDAIFPAKWISKPTLAAKYFFASGKDCCETFYSDGPCEVMDVCSTS